jgi:hypothetical protein
MRIEISGEKWSRRRGIVIYGEKSEYASLCRISITSAYVTNPGIKGSYGPFSNNDKLMWYSKSSITDTKNLLHKVRMKVE